MLNRFEERQELWGNWHRLGDDGVEVQGPFSAGTISNRVTDKSRYFVRRKVLNVKVVVGHLRFNRLDQTLRGLIVLLALDLLLVGKQLFIPSLDFFRVLPDRIETPPAAAFQHHSVHEGMESTEERSLHRGEGHDDQCQRVVVHVDLLALLRLLFGLPNEERHEDRSPADVVGKDADRNVVFHFQDENCGN